MGDFYILCFLTVIYSFVVSVRKRNIAYQNFICVILWGVEKCTLHVSNVDILLWIQRIQKHVLIVVVHQYEPQQMKK